MMSTCSLFWLDDFMRRPWAIALEGDGKKDRGEAYGLPGGASAGRCSRAEGNMSVG